MKESQSKRYIAWMAWRNLISQRRSKKGMSFMTMTSIVGVAVGVFALVVVLSVMGGLAGELKQKMFRGLPHLEILAENAVAGFSLKDYPVAKFEGVFPDAIGVEPFIQADVVIKQRKHLAGVTIFGVEPKNGARVWGFGAGMIEGKLSDLEQEHSSVYSAATNSAATNSAATNSAATNSAATKSNGSAEELFPGIVLGESLAIQLAASVGDEVVVLSPQASLRNALASNSISRKFVVSGIFRTDLPRFDSKYAVVNLAQGRKFMVDYDDFLDKNQYVTGVALNFENPEEVDMFVQQIDNMKGLKALSWKKVNKSLLFALKLEKFTMGSILLLIVLVAAFSISGTMMMTVYHRRSQIALLKSLGMARRDIVRLFLAHGVSIGTVGILLGLGLGVGVCGVLYYLPFIDLPEGVYYQKQLPVEFLPVEYCVIAGAAWLLSVCAATYPALVASRQDPGNGLRYR